jgi:hypothetical protein
MREARAITVVEWLLDSDPSIRWQVIRDLSSEPHEPPSARVSPPKAGAAAGPGPIMRTGATIKPDQR